MAPEIPTQFEYEQLLSGTFPGFFSALSIFMLIDVVAPIDLTSWVMNNITGLAGFVGVIILVGTILGIVIDGLHHAIIEDVIFANFIGFRETYEFCKALRPQTKVKQRHYFYNLIGTKAVEIDRYVTDKTYRYSEFHSNIFISMIPFSIILPFYLFYVLQIPWSYSLTLALILLPLASYGLKNSYDDYIEYMEIQSSLICGYLNYPNYIYIKGDKNSNSEIKITAVIMNKECEKCIPTDYTNINFKTTLGKINPTTIETNRGKATTTLTLDQNYVNNGKAIVIASSEKCIPGVTIVSKDGIKCFNFLRDLVDLCIFIPIIILASIIAIVAQKMFDLNIWEFFVLFFGTGFIILFVVRYFFRDYLLDEDLLDEDSKEGHSILDQIRKSLSKNAFTITITLIGMLLIAFATLFIYTPIQITLEPKNFEEYTFLGDQFARTISVKNLGTDLTDVIIYIQGIKDDWISLNTESFRNLKSGELKFAQVNITIPRNEFVGEYRGAIIIQAKANRGNVTEVIPVLLHINSSAIPQKLATS